MYLYYEFIWIIKMSKLRSIKSCLSYVSFLEIDVIVPPQQQVVSCCTRLKILEHLREEN